VTQAIGWLIAAGVFFAIPLPFVSGAGTLRRLERILFHVLAMQSFAVAGWLLESSGRAGGGWVVLAGFVTVGVFWVGSVRRRIRESRMERLLPVQGPASAPAEGDAVEPGESLEPSGRMILMRLLSLRELPVGSIATPREEIVYADCAAGVRGAVDQIRASGFLRIPMVDGSLDRIIGIVHAKDILRHDAVERNAPPLKSLLRRPLFVGQEKTAASLLETFRSQRSHMAIVVDVFGRTTGLITRDDLFHHLSGGEQEKP
jgi:CBS domain containing-hemolysin-like protein